MDPQGKSRIELGSYPTGIKVYHTRAATSFFSTQSLHPILSSDKSIFSVYLLRQVADISDNQGQALLLGLMVISAPPVEGFERSQTLNNRCMPGGPYSYIKF